MKGNTSTLLTYLSAVGLLATTALAVRATPEAHKRCEALRLERSNNYEPRPTAFEYVKAAWKCYIPASLVGVSTLLCMFGANELNKKQQASLVSAYALAENAYKEYRSKAKQILGNEADDKIRESIVEDKYEDLPESPVEEAESYSEMCLFYDPRIGYFESAMQPVELDDGLECFIIDVPNSRKTQQIL